MKMHEMVVQDAIYNQELVILQALLRHPTWGNHQYLYRLVCEADGKWHRDESACGPDGEPIGWCFDQPRDSYDVARTLEYQATERLRNQWPVVNVLFAYDVSLCIVSLGDGTGNHKHDLHVFKGRSQIQALILAIDWQNKKDEEYAD